MTTPAALVMELLAVIVAASVIVNGPGLVSSKTASLPPPDAALDDDMAAARTLETSTPAPRPARSLFFPMLETTSRVWEWLT